VLAPMCVLRVQGPRSCQKAAAGSDARDCRQRLSRPMELSVAGGAGHAAGWRHTTHDGLSTDAAARCVMPGICFRCQAQSDAGSLACCMSDMVSLGAALSFAIVYGFVSCRLTIVHRHTRTCCCYAGACAAGLSLAQHDSEDRFACRTSLPLCFRCWASSCSGLQRKAHRRLSLRTCCASS
jgi:hypothetical protein